jgi:hypothetical protein
VKHAVEKKYLVLEINQLPRQIDGWIRGDEIANKSKCIEDGLKITEDIRISKSTAETTIKF